MEKKKHHIMLDIETLALTPDAVILSIGAVRFEPYPFNCPDFVPGEFYSTVNIHGQERRNMSSETIDWWMRQSEEARKAAFDKNAPSLIDVLTKLDSWISATPKEDTVVWANGVTFDIAVLEHAYKTETESSPPWRYQNVSCMRTLRNLCPVDLKDDIPKVGTSHHALDDAIWQARYVRAALQWMLQDF